MADMTAVRNALAAQITTGTGLRTQGQPRDQISPPVAVIVPREPPIVYGDTMDGAMTFNLTAVLMLSDAAPSEKTQRALDVYLGIGGGEAVSIAGAIMADPSLGGVVHSAVPISVSSYNRVVYADVTYFGARVNFEIITI